MTNPIIKVLTNENLFKFILSKVVDLNKAGSWRRQYSHWNSLEDLVENKHFGLIFDKLKIKKHFSICNSSLHQFVKDVPNIDVFNYFYIKKRHLFLDSQLIYSAIENGSLDIFTILFNQSYPCSLFQNNYTNIVKLLNTVWQRSKYEIYFYLINLFNGTTDSFGFRQKAIDLFNLENIKKHPNSIRTVLDRAPSWFLSKLFEETKGLPMESVVLTVDLEVIQRFMPILEVDKYHFTEFSSIGYHLFNIEKVDYNLIHVIQYVMVNFYSIHLDFEDLAKKVITKLKAACKSLDIQPSEFPYYLSKINSLESNFLLIESIIYLLRVSNLFDGLEESLLKHLGLILQSDPYSSLYVSYITHCISQSYTFNLVCRYGTLKHLNAALQLVDFDNISPREAIESAILNSNTTIIQTLIELYQSEILKIVSTSHSFRINERSMYLISYLLEKDPFIELPQSSLVILDKSLLPYLVSMNVLVPRILEPLNLPAIALTASRNGLTNIVSLLMVELPEIFTPTLLSQMFKESLAGQHEELSKYLVSSQLWISYQELTIPCQFIGKLGYIDQFQLVAEQMTPHTLELTMKKAIEHGRLELIQYLISNNYQKSLSSEDKMNIIRFGHKHIAESYLDEFKYDDQYIVESIFEDQVEIYQLLFDQLSIEKKSYVLQRLFSKLIETKTIDRNKHHFIILYAICNGAIII
ncbi:hypothetical protein PPL_01009 [Heterostelium album PN500]|uniref:Ankyrin repeat-containing protein n=1 Tax=Heterostelium pallidum (strain ATCC 26659 / Pp 5 / PN500) TaxID=670386 RepID=D3AXV2_HETP5|nr:hypothetical protein PPL_01009 [Heterostelium album PN500]EFA85779.1 hypothetical protein PPL_01009 [Heterostelium album PN500]|eukprot:XP_020437885.1 hypothetical protein PPL_01009 [Heterostelium album PN500]